MFSYLLKIEKKYATEDIKEKMILCW